ncbi:hypothetical protein [Streptomyces hydrogenans]|uniref:hypothetical protein n=1 Tax=Streptomyces hydrogenans TaxID=1873719 RepID=UPI003805C8E9
MNLEENFGSRAGHSIRRALEDWAAGDEQFSVMHAGIACEYALKAYLVRRDPGLVDSSKDKALIHYTLGTGGKQNMDLLSQANTISLREAWKQCGMFWGKANLPLEQAEFNLIEQARNGEVHLAWHNSATTQKSLEHAVTLTEVVRADLGIDPSVFWGPFADVYADLKKVKALRPAQAEARPTLEEALEVLARQQCENGRHAARLAVVVAGTAVPGSEPVGAAHAAAWAALQTTGAHAQRAAVDLLEEYDILPLDGRPDVWHTGEPVMYLRAHDAVTVKRRVAFFAYKGFVEGCREHPLLYKALRRVMSRQYPDVPRPEQPGELLYLDHCGLCRNAAGVYGQITEDPCDCEVRECGSGECFDHPDGVIRTGLAERYFCPGCSLTLDHVDELDAMGFPRAAEYDAP